VKIHSGAVVEPAEATAPNVDLARNARVMIVGTALSRLTGFLRFATLAFAFGGSRLSDAYNLANTTPNILYDFTAGGIFAATLVPVFVAALRRRQGDQDWDAVSAVFSVGGAVLVLLSGIFFLLVPTLIRLYTVGLHDAGSLAERRLATDLLYLFVPQLALYGVVSLMTALLNARSRFGAAAYAPIANNLVVVATILVVHQMSPAATVTTALHDPQIWRVLGIGTTLGVLAIAVVMLPALRAAAPGLHWHWRPRHPAIRRMRRLAGWTFGFVAANQIAFFLVTVLANRHAGDLTAYTYAYWLFQLPYGIFAVSVMAALEPDLAREWVEGDIDAYRRQFVHGIKLVAGLVLPASLGYVVLARPAVQLLLEHGNFTAHNARTTADVLAIMALGLPFFSIFLLCARAFQSMQDTKTMFMIYLVENGVNVVLAFLLYPLWGVQGLAASFSLAYAGGCLVALGNLRRRVGGLREGRLGTMLYRITFAALFTADLALLVSNSLAASSCSCASPPR
jgi:putative peptidoglycan lipid II flippase